MTSEQAEVLHFYNANYDLCVQYILEDEKKIYLGEKTNRVCRFCGRSETSGATFKKEAHALSHFISNNRLFSYYECDDCNQKYAQFENDYAAYMKLYHCFLQVYGKNGIPSYKVWKSRIDAQKNYFEIKIFEDDPTLTAKIDEDSNTLTIETKITYTPLYVYKALLKMALTILPDDDFQLFKNALSLLNSNTALPTTKIPVLFRLYGQSVNIYKHVAAMVFKQKEQSTKKIPPYWFVLAYNNICIQMPLFGCDLDKKIDGMNINLIPILTPPDIEEAPIINQKWLDLSRSEQIKNEPISLSLQFEKMDSVDLKDSLEDRTTNKR